MRRMVSAATAFNAAKGATSLKLHPVPKPHRWRELDQGIAQFYGAVGKILCTTLWDPGCSHNFITPAFADVLVSRGARWKYCEPMVVDHGSGKDGGVRPAAPAVRSLRADVVLKTKGHTFVGKQVLFYVYPGALPDVMFCRKELESLQCVEEPSSKLLDWEVTEADLESLSHVVDAAILQAHCIMNSTHTTSTEPVVTPKESVQQLLKEMCTQRELLRERVGKAVSAEAVAAVAAVIDKYPDNFRPPGRDPCKLGVFSIKLKDNTKSFVCLPRRTNPLVMEEMRRQVAEQEAAGVIERCETNPASVYAICMARHPSKPGLRFCLDARPLNANTILMPYAVPDISESLDNLSGYKMYCSFDLSAYFQQFELEESCRDLVAFLIPGDDKHPAQVWRYKRLTFGLVNASFWAQKMLAEALSSFPGCESLRNFIDDICIGANTVDEMVAKVTALMEFCRFYNLRLKREKSQLCVGAVRHLGFIVSEEGKSLDPARVDSLVNMKAPSNVKALKSLLGSFSFVRGWLADASTTTAPLTDLLSTAAKKRGWAWGKEQEDALAHLKILAQTAPTLCKPDHRLPFHIYVDASDVGVGAVLVQWVMDEATGKLKARGIDYKSRRFSARERAWVVGEKEAFACKYGLEKFKEHILLHPDVTLHCDHHNMLNMWSCASAKIARWRLYLQQFEPFKIVHVPGRDNIVADCLSRLHLHNLAEPAPANCDDEESRLAEEGEGGSVEGLMNCTWAEVVSEVNGRYVGKCNEARSRFSKSLEKEREEQEDPGRITLARDPDERALEEALRNAVHITADKSLSAEVEVDNAAAQQAVAEALEGVSPSQSHRGAQWASADQRDARLLGKSAFPHKRIISLAHDGTHPSFATTWARVQRAIGLPPGENGAKLKQEVKHYCDTCLCCAKLKPARQKLEAKAGSIRQRPFSQYAFDVIVLTEPDSRGFRYILTVVDSFSGAIELFALKHADVPSVSDCLHDVLSRWSRPHSVRCDNAKSFAAAAVKEMLRMARIEQHFVAPYSHVSNGQVENANRRVEYILRAMVLDQRLGPASKLSWSRLIPAVRGVLNSRVVGRHGCTPNDLTYGATSDRGSHIFEDEPWMQGCAFPEGDADSLAAQNASLDTAEWRRQHQVLLEKCEAVQDDLLQKLADANLGGDDVDLLEPGDTVLLSLKGRRHHKLSAPWAGPYLVLDSPASDDGTNVVLVQHLATKDVTRVHVNDIKRCSLDHFASIDEALPLAALDNFEYRVERVLQHRPAGKRKLPGKRARAKSEYEFEVLWADLPLEEDSNPSWEPWSNGSLRSCEAYEKYCRLPEVVDELGGDFYAGEAAGLNDW